MKKIIEDNDLGIPYSNVVNRTIINLVKKGLGIDKLNALYDNIYAHKGVDFAKAALKELDVKCKITGGGIDNIPEEGGFIVIANHPHGALDGIIMADLVVRKRPDTKFMGNFLLEKIEPLREMFLPVNPFNSRASRNVPAIRTALKHVEEGNGLIIFPSGEVSTYYNSSTICEDKEWEPAIMKFIKSLKVPVIPIYISGKNSMKFHFVGKIHPSLRTVRLPLELLNKEGKNIKLVIGSPITVRRQSELSNMSQFSDYMRANVYYLMWRTINEQKQADSAEHAELIAQPDNAVIRAEIENLKGDQMLVNVGDYTVYCADAIDIPTILREISRLREFTFRHIGEGTSKSEDSDAYDKYYKHLFIWNAQTHEVVGAYRVGFGSQILKEYGIEGFYTNTLFEYSSKFAGILENSIELGRSFIIPEYQKKTKSLMLLWQGILTILQKNPQIKYLLGPVSISNDYSIAAKVLMMSYIKTHHWDSSMSKMVIARNGTKAIQGQKRINTELLKSIKDINLIDKLIMDLDEDSSPIPVLIRKYLQIGGIVLSFNVDPAFNNSLDALLLLDTSKVPHNTIEMLSR